MVTRILLDPRRDVPNATANVAVILSATPTHLRENGQVIILPSTLTFTVDSGDDLVQLPPTLPSYAWRLTVRQNGAVKQERTVVIPDVNSVAWADLVDVDPASLGETAGHARQWDATFYQLVQLIENTTGGTGGGTGSTGFQYLQSTPASTWTVAHSLGRRPGVEVYTLAGQQVFTDVTADTSSATITFPAPTTGYAVLT